MASSPITSWQIEGEKVEAVTGVLFLGFKITADIDCSHKIKRCVLLVKKAERQRIESFELWCWKRLLRVPWIARRSNQSILKEISPRCSLEGLMIKLKLQYFGPHAKS